jgi:hypothetical protein
VLEVEVQRARDVVIEQQHGRPKRNEEERQNEPASPSAHSEKRKEDQNKDNSVQQNLLINRTRVILNGSGSRA